MHKQIPLFIAAAIALGASTARSDNWPQWRGPAQCGVAPGTNYPTEWSEDKNIVWKVSLPGWGTSTPAVWGEQIFVTATGDENNNLLICLDRAGKEQWRVPLGSSAANRNPKASGANPSPVTDGERIYAYFKSGDLGCVDLSGKIVWSTNIQASFGPDGHQWDLGTSPLLTADSVIIAVMHQAPSYLLAFDKRSGEVKWKQSRDLGAPQESRDSYTTPILIDEAGRSTVVVLGADHVTGHDAETGEEIWRFGNLNPDRQQNFRQIASPVAVGNMLVAPYSRGATLTAIRLGGNGDVTDSHRAWLSYSSSDVPSPVVYDGRIYLCGDRGEIKCVDVETGKDLWGKRLPRNRYNYSASPVIADGKLYVTREDGTTFVLTTGAAGELIATNALRENTYATPVFVDGQLFVRTSDFLFCIGQD